jgi:hypothetical protein
MAIFIVGESSGGWACSSEEAVGCWGGLMMGVSGGLFLFGTRASLISSSAVAGHFADQKGPKSPKCFSGDR